MAIVREQYKVGQGGAFASIDVTFDTNVTAGSLLLCCVSAWDSSGVGGAITFADDNSNSWTENYDNNYDGNDVGALAYVENANSGSTTVTASGLGGGSFWSVVIVEVSGIKTTTALDQNSENTASSASWDSGNITTTENDEYLIGGLAHDNGDHTLTFEEETGSSDMPISVGERIVSSTLTESYSGTIASSSPYWSAIASFEMTAAAGALSINVSDDIEISEAVTADVSDLQVSSSDDVEISETITARVPTDPSVSDSVEISDSIAADILLEPVVSDSVEVSDSIILAVSDPALTISDNTTVSDSVTVTISAISDLTIDTSDDVEVSDSATVDIQTTANVIDNVEVSESVSATVGDPQAIISDDAEVSDSVTVALGAVSAANVTTSDNIEISESVTATVSDPQLITSDNVTVVDSTGISVIAAGVVALSVSDDITATDTVIISVSEPAISISDSVDVSDSASVEIVAARCLGAGRKGDGVTIVVEGTTSGGVGNGGADTSTLTSWTPGANELVLLFVAMRDETITPTANGNGITFTQIHDIDNTQAQGGLTVLRGMDSSPTTGSITVTHTGNGEPASCIAVRFSGVDTSGTNGSGAIGNTATDTGPDPDDDDALISVTVDDSNNFAVFSAWSRSAAILDDPPASGETTILINQLFGTGGARTRCHVWYQTGSSGSVQGGTAANLSVNADHVESGVEVKIAAIDPEPSISDNATITDSIVADVSDPQIVISDNVTITDSVTANLVVGAVDIGSSDNATITDSITLDVSGPQISAQSDATATDSASADVSDPATIITDNATVTDSATVSVLSAGTNVNVSDNVTIEDIPRFFPEVVFIRESVTVQIEEQVALSVNVSDSIDVTDSATADIPLGVSVSDSATIADSASATVSDSQITIADNATITDSAISSVVAAGAAGVNVQDDVTVTDNISVGVSDLQISIADSTTIIDSVTVSVVAVGVTTVSVQDDATIADSVSAV
ncbi:MAG: beta strand repeat-containing protein, partial [Planctomycetota bacterium]